jgi:hypothetical protein
MISAGLNKAVEFLTTHGQPLFPLVSVQAHFAGEKLKDAGRIKPWGCGRAVLEGDIDIQKAETELL